MTINSPIVTQSAIVEIPIVSELMDLITLISQRPVALIVVIVMSILGYFAFRK